MKNDLPKVVWANSVNLVGLYSHKPIRCQLREEYLDINKPLWDDNEDFSVEKLGLDIGDRRIVFSSINKQEVENWISGVRSAHHLICTNSKFGAYR